MVKPQATNAPMASTDTARNLFLVVHIYDTDKLYTKMLRYPLEIDWNLHHQHFYWKSKVNNKNDMAAHAFWAVFCSSQRPSEIIPITENDAAAIPPAIFVLGQTTAKSFNQTRSYPFDTHVYFAVA